jgi:hypothetical protein
MKFVPRIVLEKIRLEPRKMRVLRLVVVVLRYLPYFLERCGIHAVQPAEVADKRPSQGLACWDWRKGVRKILELAEACECWRPRRGSPRYRCFPARAVPAGTCSDPLCQGETSRHRSDPVGGVMAVALGRTVNCVVEDEPSARRRHESPECGGPPCFWIGPA